MAIVAAMAVAPVSALFAQQFTVALKNGEKVTYNNADVDSIYFHETIEPQEPVTVAPKIGDYYYSDGSWSTALAADKTPIGVVFCVGIATDYKDRTTYYNQKDGETPMTDFHGYVIALNDATGLDGADTEVWWSPFNNDGGAGCSIATDDFLGYTNTLSIMTAAGGSLTDKNFPAAYYATTLYENAVPAPALSSGWFLPSIGQWSYIWNRVYFDEDESGRACVARSLAELGDKASLLYTSGSEYWSSTEKVDSYGVSNFAYYFCFDSSMFDPGFVADYRKNAGFRVRPILAF